MRGRPRATFSREKEETFDLIYQPRFKRAIDETFGMAHEMLLAGR